MNKEEIIPFLKEIEVEAEKLFLNKLEDAVEGRVKKLEDIPWPNYTLMHRLYPDNALVKRGVLTKMGKKFNADQSSYNVVDIFNQEGEIKYSIDSISSHPPYFNLSAEEKFIINGPDPKIAKAVKKDVDLMFDYDYLDRETIINEFSSAIADDTVEQPNPKFSDEWMYE